MIRKIFMMVFGASMLMASTYGPSAPEVAKFEPAEATELVNLYTGDFIYTLPLFEVPGPGGGYPIVLSYKAGIPLEDEASTGGLNNSTSVKEKGKGN